MRSFIFLSLLTLSLAQGISVWAQTDFAPQEESQARSISTEPVSVKKIPKSRINGVGKNFVRFPVRPFGEVQLGDRFFIITAQNDGVLQELEVTRLADFSKRMHAYARMVGAPYQGNVSEFLKAKVARVEHIRAFSDLFSDGPLSPLEVVSATTTAVDLPVPVDNPLARIAYIWSRRSTHAADIFTGVNLAESLQSQALEVDSFFPLTEAVSWLNVIGVSANLAEFAPSQHQLARVGTGTVTSATLGGRDINVYVVLRPTSSSRWMTRFSLGVGVYSRLRETMTLGEGTSSSSFVYEMQSVPAFIMWECNPFSHLTAGVGVQGTLGPGKVTIREVGIAEDSGFRQDYAALAQAGFRYGWLLQTRRIVLDGGVGNTWIWHKNRDLPLSDKVIRAQQLRLWIGLGYHH